MSSPSQGISLNIQNGEMRLRTKKLYDYLYSNVIKGLVLISAFMFTISFLLITEKEEIILIKNHFNKSLQDRIYGNKYQKKSKSEFFQRSISVLSDEADENNKKSSIIDNVSTSKVIYGFLNNLTTLNYVGQWQNLIFEENQFNNEYGNVDIEFKKQSTNYYNNFNLNTTILKMIFLLKDDKYIDNYIKGSVVLAFDSTFANSLNKTLFSIYNPTNQTKLSEKSNILSFKNTNASLDFYSCSFLKECKKINYKDIKFSINFIPKEKILLEKHKGRFVSTFSKINVKFQDSKGKFTLDFSADVHVNKNFSIGVRNYSFMLTALAFIEMYFVVTNMVQIKDDLRKCLGMDLITICVSVITKALICTVHFYLSVTSKDDEISYEYGVPAIVYFIVLSFFEVRTLFYIFKAKYIFLYETNPNSFRTRLYICSFIFYFTVFACLILCRLLVMNFGTCYFLFFATWGFQIFHSARVGIRPPMNVGYIFGVSLGKIFIPIYLKAYPNNIFEFKPSYDKTAIIVSTVLIQISILLLQKNYGSKVIVPSIIKRYHYNYYYDDYVTRDEMIKTQECAICLSTMISLNFEEQQQQRQEENNGKAFFISRANKLLNLTECFKRMNNFFLIIKRYFRKKPFMITPCNHVFHSECLEKWLELKSECPYCKQQLPQLE